MSLDAPSEPGDTIGTLPESEVETRTGPRPVAHGSAVQCVFNERSDALDPYADMRELWLQEVGEPENEPLLLELDEDALDWVPGGRFNSDWVLSVTSSGWKAGRGEGDNYRQFYQYHVKLREVDEEGELHKPPLAVHLEIIPQKENMNYRDGNELELPYGPGSLVKCWTTWADSSDEVESRMLDILEETLGASPSRLQESRVYDSRRMIKAESHHRFNIGWKRQVIDAIDNTRELIAFGGQSEIESQQKRQREGYLESVLDADRWHKLGFKNTSWNTELKVYQAPGWADRDNSDPARHPKIEASFSGVDGSGELPHVEDWDEVLQELRRIVSSHLDWAGVGRSELVEDEYQDGPNTPDYSYKHPVGRREQLRARYEDVATDVYREGTKQSTTAVYDILRVIASERGAHYDMLESRTGLARSTIRYHIRRLDESGVVDRVGNPVLVVFPSLVVLDKADEILKTIYPDDMVEDMESRAERRRERREESREDGREEDEDRDTSESPDREDEPESATSSTGSSSWTLLEDLQLGREELATALQERYIQEDEVRLRTDRRDWII